MMEEYLRRALLAALAVLIAVALPSSRNEREQTFQEEG